MRRRSTPATSPSTTRHGGATLDTFAAAVSQMQSLRSTGGGPGRRGDAAEATSTVSGTSERTRIIALVELARDGDAEAFGQLYDHYVSTVYRFLYYRTRAHALAEDLTSETFYRALRSMSSFRWQGRDFGAWLITIARNLVADHYKASRTRLEFSTDDLSGHDRDSGADTAEDAIKTLAHEALGEALAQLPTDQQDCLIMRFIQSLSIAETAKVMDRSEGAVKQLQLRGVRSLATLLPPEWGPQT